MKKKRTTKPYTKEEIQFLTEKGGSVPLPDLAFLLGRSEWSIRAKLREIKDPEKERQRLFQSKVNRRAKDKKRLGGRQYDYWSVEEHAIILFSDIQTAILAYRMKRTVESVNSMRRRLRQDKEAFTKARIRWKEIRGSYERYFKKSNPHRKP